MATWLQFLLIHHHPNPISIKPDPFISPGRNIKVEDQSGQGQGDISRNDDGNAIQKREQREGGDMGMYVYV